MQRFLSVLGWVALGLLGIYLATIALDAISDVSREVYWWARFRLFPGFVWAGIIGVGLYGAYVFFGGRGN